MANVFVEYLEDSFDCETCGGSWEEGAIVCIDGEEVLSVEPIAHCYNTNGMSHYSVMRWILNHLGIEFDSEQHLDDYVVKDLVTSNGHNYVSHYELPDNLYDEDDEYYPEGWWENEVVTND